MITGEGHILEDFMTEMKRLSGLGFCLYELSFFTEDAPGLQIADGSLRCHCSPVCDLLKSTRAGTDKCVEVENWRAHKSAKHPKGFVHECYAGVVDFIMPIFIHNKHVGALMMGHAVLDDLEKIESACQKLAELGVTIPDLQACFRRMPRVTDLEIRQTSKLVNVARSYIEQTEQLLAIGREYNLLVSNEVSTAEAAVRTGKLPFTRLHSLRSQLHGNAAKPIRKALDEIQKSYFGDVKIERVAKQVGVSNSHLSREFHRQTGFTFRQIVMETKLGSALFLIKKYGTSISEAAFLVGYSDEFSFRRAFVKLTGLTPRAFMRRFPRAFDVVE